MPEDHPVHYIRQVVAEELDLSPIFESYRDGAGAPAFHPAMLTALLVYGYSDGVRSSRKLARACRERTDFKKAQGIRRFLLRGFEKVGLEWQLICTSHNLRKLTKAMA